MNPPNLDDSTEEIVNDPQHTINGAATPNNLMENTASPRSARQQTTIPNSHFKPTYE
jgi:hypothetical protein